MNQHAFHTAAPCFMHQLMNPHRPKRDVPILSKSLPYAILAFMPRASSWPDGGLERGASYNMGLKGVILMLSVWM